MLLTTATALLSTLSLTPLLAVMNLWYAVPLIVSVSLVCSATRQEEMPAILNHAFRFAVWILVFMAIVMAGLALLGRLA